ncbi:MAG: hypothetical protein ACO3A4_08430 [Silvanigrellaceae bacterium]
MRITFIMSAIPLLLSCGVNTEYSSSGETGVVITKNPKGQSPVGGSSGSETRRVQFGASWLSANSELLLELRSVSLTDSSSAREIVGTVDAGRFLVLTRGVSATVEFSADAELLKKAKFIDFVIDKAMVRKGGKIISNFSNPSILTLPFDYATAPNSASTVPAYTSAKGPQSGSECSFNPVLLSVPGNSSAPKKCGGDDDDDGSDSD